jgi:hypothetical protein
VKLNQEHKCSCAWRRLKCLDSRDAHSSGRMFSRRKVTISSVEVPGRNTAATPFPSASVCLPAEQCRPPGQDSHPSPVRESLIERRGQRECCELLRMETPTASTSSCTAAAAIISRLPQPRVDHFHAGIAQLGNYLAPRSCPSRPGFATRTRICVQT